MAGFSAPHRYLPVLLISEKISTEICVVIAHNQRRSMDDAMDVIEFLR